MGVAKAPHVRAAAAFPTVAPRFVERLAGARHGLEFPELRTRAHIECARIAGGALRHFAARRADDRDVLENRRRAAVGDADVHRAVGAEAGGRRARRRIDCDQVGAAHEQNARRQRAVAGPVADAARRCRRTATTRTATAAGRRCRARGRRRRRGQHVFPNQRARVAVERDDAVAARQVHDAADDDRHGGRVAAELIRPARGQRRDVRSGDLRQRRKAVRAQVAIDEGPVAWRNAGRCGRRCRRGRRRRGRLVRRLTARRECERQFECNRRADELVGWLHDRPPSESPESSAAYDTPAAVGILGPSVASRGRGGKRMSGQTNGFRVLAAAAFLLTSVANAALDEPLKLDAGLLGNSTESSPQIRAFKGIPFAAPPVGALRWQAPQPVAQMGRRSRREQVRQRLHSTCGADGGPRRATQHRRAARLAAAAARTACI